MQPNRDPIPVIKKCLLFFAMILPVPLFASDQADVIYRGGAIITIVDAAPIAQAIAIRNGRILAIGTESDVMATKGAETRVVDLQGKALLPGFIDGHSHFINSLSVASQANVYPPPFGPGDSVEGIIAALNKLKAEQDVRPGRLILAYGYDENVFPKDAPLTAADLDAHFPDNPVMVQHISLHGAVLNSVALKQNNIDATTPTPPGGIIVRKSGSNEPAGMLMETAFMPIFEALPKPQGDARTEAIKRGQTIYAAAGITTAHEGASTLADINILKQAAQNNDLFIDVVAFPFITEMDRVLDSFPAKTFGVYNQRFKLGGIKITIDGSPQGKTAQFTTPYLTGGPGGETSWRGESTFPIDTFNGMVQKVYSAGLPLIVHCNGDAAIDHFLTAHEMALGDAKAGDHRSAIIHCQFVREDQLDKIAAWNLIPSFYTEHTYFFASTHIKNRGRKQGSFISPTKTALKKGIRFANHTDFNVAPIDQLFVAWSAVNRMSREGGVIGPEERISPLEALKALTIYPAYWYREEDRKGSLEVGKLADLVILDKSPLTVKPMAIKDIKVLETIKEGTTIYTASIE